MHTDSYLSNQSNHSSTPDQIAPFINSSSSNCGNVVVSNDIQSAHQAVSLNTGVSTKGTGVLLATARVYAVGLNGTKIQVRALIDPGSEISLITQALCNQFL